MVVERNEIPGFEDFYKPLTSREQTLPKLQALRTRLMVDVSNVDLFEALADTFATLQTEEFESGKVYDDVGTVAEKWEAADEVYPSGSGGPCIGFDRAPGPRYRREEIFMVSDEINMKGALYFIRDSEENVITELRGEDIEEFEPSNDVKQKILDACIAGFSSQS